MMKFFLKMAKDSLLKVIEKEGGECGGGEANNLFFLISID